MPPKGHAPKSFTYSYPDTAERYFGMRDRTKQTLDPESPTVKREFEIQSRGGAYADRIIRRPRGPSQSRVLERRRSQRA